MTLALQMVVEDTNTTLSLFFLTVSLFYCYYILLLLPDTAVVLSMQLFRDTDEQPHMTALHWLDRGLMCDDEVGLWVWVAVMILQSLLGGQTQSLAAQTNRPSSETTWIWFVRSCGCVHISPWFTRFPWTGWVCLTYCNSYHTHSAKSSSFVVGVRRHDQSQRWEVTRYFHFLEKKDV